MRSQIRLLLVLVFTTVYLGGVLPTHAACESPTLEISQLQVAPGDEIEVVGHSWMSGCDDAAEDGGCGSSPESEPIEGIEVSLKGPRTDQTQQQLNVGRIGETEIAIELATVNANSEGRFTVNAAMPDVPPGVYFITAEGDLPAYQPPQITITD